MARVLIIGYGNPLRGDDGLGLHLAQRLQDDAQDNADIEIIACHQLTLELAEPLSRAPRAIFVDAAESSAPGEMTVNTLDASSNVDVRFTHHLTPQTLLGYAQALYGARPSETFLITVCGKDFGYGETLSDTAARAMERARAHVLTLCARKN